MTSYKRLRDSEEREKRRQEWAALQIPELVTTKQALEMFNRLSYPGFADFMKQNNVSPIRNPAFYGSFFYVKSEVEKLVIMGLLAPKRKGRPPGSQNSPKRVTFESMQDGNWDKEQFLEAWGSTADKDQAASILDRAPSFYLLPPLHAYQLMLILLKLGGQDFRLSAAKYDRRFFIKYARQIATNKLELNSLLKIFYALYGATDIGVFDPAVTISILYELMSSKPVK